MKEEQVYSEKAKKLFREGYNCAQSVLCAFADKLDIDILVAKKLASSFGGGMGRLREVCGAVTGMFMVVGMLYGYDDPLDRQLKTAHYTLIQELAKDFIAECDSIVCRELLHLDKKLEHPLPEERTAAYYKKRPCVELVGIAAALTAKVIKESEKSEETKNDNSSSK